MYGFYATRIYQTPENSQNQISSEQMINWPLSMNSSFWRGHLNLSHVVSWCMIWNHFFLSKFSNFPHVRDNTTFKLRHSDFAPPGHKLYVGVNETINVHLPP